MQQSSLVLTVIGDDHPGIVESLANAISKQDGNWEEGRFVRLAGKFTGVLRVHVPAGQAEALAADLRDMTSKGLSVHVEAVETEDSPISWPSLKLEAIGHDRPGIIREISHALTERGINVVELETERYNAPMSGEMIFKAVAIVRVPPELDLDELHNALDHIGHELMVEVTLNENDQASQN